MRVCTTVVMLLALVSAPAAHAQDSSQPVCSGTAGYAAYFQGRQTYLWRPQDVLAAQSKVHQSAASMPAYAEVMRSAETALSAGPWSVTDKTRVAPSLDRHDYTSLAPYY